MADSAAEGPGQPLLWDAVHRGEVVKVNRAESP